MAGSTSRTRTPAGGGARHLRPVPERAPGRDRRLVGRGDRGEEHLHRCRGSDSPGYPDCRPEFYEAMNETIRRGTKEGSGIVVKAPFVHLLKKDIVFWGNRWAFPSSRPGRVTGKGRRRAGAAIRARFGCAPSPRPGSRSLPYEDGA